VPRSLRSLRVLLETTPTEKNTEEAEGAELRGGIAAGAFTRPPRTPRSTARPKPAAAWSPGFSRRRPDRPSCRTAHRPAPPEPRPAPPPLPPDPLRQLPHPARRPLRPLFLPNIPLTDHPPPPPPAPPPRTPAPPPQLEPPQRPITPSRFVDQKSTRLFLV